MSEGELYHTARIWRAGGDYHVRVFNNDGSRILHASGVGLAGDAVAINMDPEDDAVIIEAADKLISVKRVAFDDPGLMPEIHLEFVDR